MTGKKPIDLLFSGSRRKLLALLLTHPDERFSVREISRRTGVAPGALHRELKMLHQVRLLLRQPLGNQVCYFVDRNSSIYGDLLNIFQKNDEKISILEKILKPICERITCAFTYRLPNAEPGASIDLFVLGSLTVDEIVQIMANAQSVLKVGLNPVVMTVEELRQKLAESDPFMDDLEAAKKTFVVGEISLFNEIMVAKDDPMMAAEPCIRGLLEMAEWNLANSEVKANNLGNRFDTAYKALLQGSLIVMLLKGRGTASIDDKTRGLLRAIAASGESMVKFDQQRKKRNNADYYGAPVDMVTTESCVAAARERLHEVRTWLQGHYPELLG